MIYRPDDWYLTVVPRPPGGARHERPEFKPVKTCSADSGGTELQGCDLEASLPVVVALHAVLGAVFMGVALTVLTWALACAAFMMSAVLL